MSKVISTKINDDTDQLLEKMAEGLNVSKSWIVQQAIKQYIEKYDSYLSDIRIASMGETISHNEVLAEYGIQH